MTNQVALEKLHFVDLGFKSAHMLTARYDLPHWQFSTQAAVNVFNNTRSTRLPSRSPPSCALAAGTPTFRAASINLAIAL